MTYILGSVCTDGIVLVADRKVMLEGGAVHEYEDKLFMCAPWMVIGSSGVLGLFEKFRDQLTDYLASAEYLDNSNVYSLTKEIEKLTREQNEDYREVLHGRVFDVLLGMQSTTEADLKYVYPSGFAEGVRRYKVIGHGEPYGSFFLKYWWRKNMTMLQVAELGFFILEWMKEFEGDNTVGIGKGYPQVVLIPNPEDTEEDGAGDYEMVPRIRSLSSSELSDVKAKVVRRVKKFREESLSWEIEDFLKRGKGGKEQKRRGET
jgi:20S proteasome alpha/beta subunit